MMTVSKTEGNEIVSNADSESLTYRVSGDKREDGESDSDRRDSELLMMQAHQAAIKEHIESFTTHQENSENQALGLSLSHKTTSKKQAA